MRDPSQIPTAIAERLGKLGLWDVNPLNLYRITWKNEPVSQGGQFGGVNYVEIPPELTGVEARIIASESGLDDERSGLLAEMGGKIRELKGYGLEIVDRVPLELPPHDDNRDYLRTKKIKMGHLLKSV